MTDQPYQSHSNPDRFTSWLWIVVGVGAAAVLLVGGLILALFPLTRNAAPPTSPPQPSNSFTVYPERTPTLTPYYTPEQTPEQTRTPSPESESGNDLDPETVARLTPDTQSGLISISPFLQADAGNYALSPGEIVLLRWEDYPPGASRYSFLFQPHGGEEIQIIGTDSNPADGVELEWLVPENIAGDLYGMASYQDDRGSRAVFAGSLYSGTAEGSSPAVNVLQEFFRTLARGEYKAASDLFGGDYSILADYNPDLDPADKAGLLERACTTNGFVCLPILKVGSVEAVSDGTFLVVVSFQNPDGSIYTQGPCCGESQEDNQGQSAFEFQVKRVDGRSWQVLDLPVYTP